MSQSPLEEKMRLLEGEEEFLPGVSVLIEPDLTPADIYLGRATEVLTKRNEIKRRTVQQRRLLNLQIVTGSSILVGKHHRSGHAFVSQMF
jgi:hypothetical protein